MAFKILSLPDWKGRWKQGAILGEEAITSKSFWEASLGWEVMKRRRKSPSISEAAFSRSAKSTSSSRSLP